MLLHLMKLIWNRKAANLLIIIEVIFTFVVLFALISGARTLYQNYHQPLGFDWQNTWSIAIDFNQRWDNDKHRGPLKDLVEVLASQSEIESVSLSSQPMLQNRVWSSSTEVDGKPLSFNVLRVNDSGPRDWGVKLVAGRWFGRQDDGQHYRPIVVNQLFVAQLLEPGQNPDAAIGMEIPFDDPVAKPRRIVGVYQHFRQLGEFSTPVALAFYRYDMMSGHRYGMANLHIKFSQSQSAIYEAKLQKLLRSVSPQWRFNVRSWRSLRQEQINMVLIPLTVVAVIVGFLLVMVAMGLLGVLWQNIHQRTREIGLRRAVGASSGSIQWQIIGELVTLALLSMAMATVLLVQLPLLGLIDTVSWANFGFSLTCAAGVIVTVVVLCALYPSRVAIKMAPALALHYD